jgi:ATP-dependent DNA helicase DinG
MVNLPDIFEQGGILSQHIEGFSSRPHQLEMAEAILSTLETQQVLVAEAGTGTGKTFAYLAPAILSSQKTFISTGTKNLQDQLFERDLPTLRKALGIPFKAALLKGRNNYLCEYRLNLARADPLLKQYHGTLQQIAEWAEHAKTGDLSEIGILEENASLWYKINSNVNTCVDQGCREQGKCFVVEARKKAQEADIVVINHHLLMSDLALKASAYGEVLPSADAYIIDEAHQLPEIATQFLSDRISSHQIQDLGRDSINEILTDAPDMAEIKEYVDKLENALHRLRIILGEDEQRFSWQSVVEKPKVLTFLTDLIDTLKLLGEYLMIAESRGKGIEQCVERCGVLQQRLMQFSHSNPTDMILWAEIQPSGFSFYATPHEVSSHFQQWMDEKPASWVFTSATLTVAGNFNNFQQQLGIEQATTEIWESPFDYAKQSLLYMPAIPVEPSDANYTDHVSQLAKELVAASEGRIFLLFTSYRAMHLVAAALEGSDYPLMVQGSGSKSSLLNEFRSHGNAVLLGTNSFWEGVDVRGEALSCVLIDKIPFASPGDPVLQARIDGMRAKGGNPFQSIQIPSAVIQLKQGIGRLIRDSSDYGVLVLCDPRLLTKPYGKSFLRSLPAMPITQTMDDVISFFEQH